MLAVVWAGVALQQRLDDTDLSRLDDLIRPWRTEIIAPLRQIRRRLKTGPLPAPTADTDNLRLQLAQIETGLERIALETLARAIPPLQDRAGNKDAAQANLLKLINPQNDADRAALHALAQALMHPFP